MGYDVEYTFMARVGVDEIVPPPMYIARDVLSIIFVIVSDTNTLFLT
jgi:hypothetical protein